MRNLLALLALAILVLAGVGYYKEWYTFKTVAAADGHKSITVDVDTQKVKDDVNSGKKEVGEFIHGK